jgi:hypothetical protein
MLKDARKPWRIERVQVEYRRFSQHGEIGFVRVKRIFFGRLPSKVRLSPKTAGFVGFIESPWVIAGFFEGSSEHLAYGAWNYRGLPFITNNQAGSMVVHPTDSSLDLYVTNENFARAKNSLTFYSEKLGAWYVQKICQYKTAAA